MPKLVLIEDEIPLLNAVVEMLEFSGFEVTAFSDGYEAVEYIRQNPPDVVLCDIMMPTVDGYEVLAMLRENSETASIPFVFMTAKADRESVRSGMNLGADDYVTKPFSIDELVGTINTRMKRRQEVVEPIESSMESLKQQLAHLVMHELRTPLVSMSTVLNVVSREMQHLPPAEFQEMVERADAGSSHLRHRIEQLVCLTQIEANLLNEATIAESGVVAPIWELLQDARPTAEQYAFQRPPEVSLDMKQRDQNAQVLCDPESLKHAFAELIANALLFSPPDGVVTLTQTRVNGNVWVSIVDNGPGILPGKLAVALEDSEQQTMLARGDHRVGMGVPLAKRIIELHGGKLEVQSVMSKGTHVFVTLPPAP